MEAVQIVVRVVKSLELTVATNFLLMQLPVHISHHASEEVKLASTKERASFPKGRSEFAISLTLLQVVTIIRNQVHRLMCFFVVILSGFS